MQDSQDLHVLVYFVNSDERKRNEYKLATAFDATRTSPIRKCVEGGDTLDDGLSNTTRGFWTICGDVVTNPFEIVGRVRGPADAHQPR